MDPLSFGRLCQTLCRLGDWALSVSMTLQPAVKVSFRASRHNCGMHEDSQTQKDELSYVVVDE